MKAKDIKSDDVFTVSPGYSVRTVSRGMAHAGGDITLVDIATEKPEEVMAKWVKSGRVKLNKEATAKARARQAEQDKVAAEVKKLSGSKGGAKKDPAPVTEAQIIEAIGKLDKENTEMWTSSGAPQVSSLEDILETQITADQRDAAWEKYQEANKE